MDLELLRPGLRHRFGGRRFGRRSAVLALLVGAVGFGIGTVATKGAMDGLPPLTLATARFAVAAVVLAALCRARGVAVVYDGRALLLGATGTAAPYALQNLGLDSIGAGVATLLIEGGLPLMTAVLGVAILGERVDGPRLVGLLLGVGGVAAVALSELGGAVPMSGALLCLGAAGALALYTVLGRQIFRGGVSLGVLTGGTVLGTMMLGPLASAEIGAGGVPTSGLGDLALVLVLGVACSALTNLLWAHGMAHLDAAEVGVLGTFMPVVGIAAAALFLGEAVTGPQLAGAALIVAGVAVTARAEDPRAATARAEPARRPRLVRTLARRRAVVAVA